MSTRALVYQFVAERGEDGATDVEIRAALEGENPRQLVRSRGKLKRDGLLRDSGGTRRTAREAVVWVAIVGDCGCLTPQ